MPSVVCARLVYHVYSTWKMHVARYDASRIFFTLSNIIIKIRFCLRLQKDCFGRNKHRRRRYDHHVCATTLFSEKGVQEKINILCNTPCVVQIKKKRRMKRKKE